MEKKMTTKLSKTKWAIAALMCLTLSTEVLAGPRPTGSSVSRNRALPAAEALSSRLSDMGLTDITAEQVNIAIEAGYFGSTNARQLVNGLIDDSLSESDQEVAKQVLATGVALGANTRGDANQGALGAMLGSSSSSRSGLVKDSFARVAKMMMDTIDGVAYPGQNREEARLLNKGDLQTAVAKYEQFAEAARRGNAITGMEDALNALEQGLLESVNESRRRAGLDELSDVQILEIIKDC
jgi:hypothetical protein